MVGMKSEVGYQYMQEQHLFDRLLVEAVPGIAFIINISYAICIIFGVFYHFMVLEKTKHVYRFILIVTRND